MTQREKNEKLKTVVVSVAMPRSEWLLLETFLIVLVTHPGEPVPTPGMLPRLEQIVAFIIEAERRAAERINSMEDESAASHYLSFVREFPCFGCGSTQKLRDACHIGPPLKKRSDLDTVPGCRDCRQELHRLGRVRYELLKGINFQEIIDLLQRLYVLKYGRLPGKEEFGETGGQDA